MEEGEPYFNSGVLLMDLVAWRKEKYGPQVMECIEKGNFRHHDQDGLNKVFRKNWQMLPLRWNVIPPVFTLPVKVLKKSRWRNLALEAMERPAVFHWAGRYKPWEFPPQKNFNQKYYDYLDKTALKDQYVVQNSGYRKSKEFNVQEMHCKLATLIRKIFTFSNVLFF